MAKLAKDFNFDVSTDFGQIEQVIQDKIGLNRAKVRVAADLSGEGMEEIHREQAMEKAMGRPGTPRVRGPDGPGHPRDGPGVGDAPRSSARLPRPKKPRSREVDRALSASGCRKRRPPKLLAVGDLSRPDRGKRRPGPMPQTRAPMAPRMRSQSRDSPAWYPAWARELADLYFSGTTCCSSSTAMSAT